MSTEQRQQVCNLLTRHTSLPPFQAAQYCGLRPGPRQLSEEQLQALAASAEVDKQAPGPHVRAAVAACEVAFDEAEAKAKAAAKAAAAEAPIAGGVDASSDQPAV